jgi:hypothetical protein
LVHMPWRRDTSKTFSLNFTVLFAGSLPRGSHNGIPSLKIAFSTMST